MTLLIEHGRIFSMTSDTNSCMYKFFFSIALTTHFTLNFYCFFNFYSSMKKNSFFRGKHCESISRNPINFRSSVLSVTAALN